MAITSVPIHTNPELRKSRLFSSMFQYVKRSSFTIIRAFMMYRPLHFFCGIGSILFLLGFALGLRFLYYFLTETGPNGHIQSLILAAVLMMLVFQTIVTGLQADIIAANRKILEDIQKKVRNIDIQLQGKDDAH